MMIKTLQSTNSLTSPVKHLEFNRSPEQALPVREVNKQEHLDRHYRSVALHTSLVHIHHRLVSPRVKEK